MEDNLQFYLELPEYAFNVTKAMQAEGSLRLVVRGNPIYCDNDLCCLKEAESQGKIEFYLGQFGKVECSNYPGAHWDQVVGCEEEPTFCDVICGSACPEGDCLVNCTALCERKLNELLTNMEC